MPHDQLTTSQYPLSDAESNESLYWRAVNTADEEAAKSLVDRLEHLVINAARKIVFCEDDAREVSNLVFSRLLQPSPQPKQIDHVAKYINTATRNTALSLIAKQARYQQLNPDHSAQIFSLLNVENDGAKRLKEEERELVRTRIREAINRLIPSQRACIQLFYLSDYSYREIQEELNCSAREVKTNIQNGKKRLKNILRTYRRQL